MFDSIRNHKKYLMGFLLILIIPSFVLFGIQGFTDGNQSGETVATVDGQDISKAEWDQWYEFVFNRNIFLCLFTVGLWTPCLLHKASVQYPGRLNWRVDHPRLDCWVSPRLVPVDDPAEGILSLNDYLLLPDPTRAELSTSPEVATIHNTPSHTGECAE